MRTGPPTPLSVLAIRARQGVRIIGALFVGWVIGGEVFAAAPELPAAVQEFRGAAQYFQDKLYDRAQQALAEFVATFPQSSRVPEAILMQAQSLLQQGNHEGAVRLLTERGAAAGDLRDQFVLWQAEAEYGRQNYAAAATNYARLLEEFPQSAQRLRASYGEAFAYFKLTNYVRTIELLRAPAGSFQTAVANDTNETQIADGHMLLAEAYFNTKEYKAGEQVLLGLGERKIDAEMNSKRLFRLGANAFADNRTNDALRWAADSLAVATNLPPARAAVARANALNLRAEIYREVNPDLAVEALRSITEMNALPTNQVHQALFKMADILVAADRIEGAIQELNNFVTKPVSRPGEEVRLRLGILYVSQFRKFTASPPNSIGALAPPNPVSLLANAKAQFDVIITNSPPSPLVGRAWYQKAWALWEEAQFTGFAPAVLAEAALAFTNGFARLPLNEEHAIARIKFADCLFWQKSFSNSIDQYDIVVGSFGDLVNIKTNYFDQCLYQIVRARLELGELVKAGTERARLIDQFPQSPYAALSLLTIAQSLLAGEKPVEARSALHELIEQYPNSPLISQSRLELARTFVRETNWVGAIVEYELIPALTNNESVRSTSEFERAWAYAQSGNRAKAFGLYTNYVVRFEASALAPLAKWWVADAYLADQNYRLAEDGYRQVLDFTNGLSLPLKWRAQLLSASAALQGSGGVEVSRIPQVRENLGRLVNEVEVTPDIKMQALFMISDAFVLEPSVDKPLERFTNAIYPLNRIINNYPTNETWVARAKARLGALYFQLAGQGDPEQAKNYNDAVTNFQAAMKPSPAIDISVRSEAEVGLGKVKDRLGSAKATAAPDDAKRLLNEALDHFLHVFYKKNLIPTAAEQPDATWVMTAGLEAAALAKRLGEPDGAASIYERLLRENPDSKELEALVKSKLAALK